MGLRRRIEKTTTHAESLPHMHTENTNSNTAPQGARSLSLTVKVSPTQADALAAFAGDRGITQADALLVLAFAKINTHGSLEEEAGFLESISEIVLNEGRAGDVKEGEPLPYEAEDLKCVEPKPKEPGAPGEMVMPMIGGKPFKGFDAEEDGEGWKQG